MPRFRSLLGYAAMLTLAVSLTACGGSKSNNNAATSEEPAAATETPAVKSPTAGGPAAGRTAQAAATPDPNSPDCRYATAAFGVIFGFALSSVDDAQSGSSNGTPGPAGTPAPTPEQIKSAIDKSLTAAGQATTEMNKIVPLAAGDTKKASDLLNTALQSAGENLDQKYPDLSARFGACLN